MKIEADELEFWALSAQQGDRQALESLVSACQDRLYGLALRFLGQAEDAEDAVQEILIRLITHLSSFRGDSQFSTWLYRVACNTLQSSKMARLEKQALSFEGFAADLADGLMSEADSLEREVDTLMIREEIKIGCTLAMLQCLNREQRLAYILGEILEMEHRESAHVLEVSPATYRKRLPRARSSINQFMSDNCGLLNPANDCRCHKRIPSAMALGRLQPGRLVFASGEGSASQFSVVLKGIRELEETQRAAALYRSHPEARMTGNASQWLKGVIGSLKVVNTSTGA